MSTADNEPDVMHFFQQYNAHFQMDLTELLDKLRISNAQRSSIIAFTGLLNGNGGPKYGQSKNENETSRNADKKRQRKLHQKARAIFKRAQLLAGMNGFAFASTTNIRAGKRRTNAIKNSGDASLHSAQKQIKIVRKSQITKRGSHRRSRQAKAKSHRKDQRS